jgi:hypothetical protein
VSIQTGVDCDGKEAKKKRLNFRIYCSFIFKKHNYFQKMTDFQINKWQEILSAEVAQTMGIRLLYERYERFLNKLESESDETIFIEIQYFKVRLAVQYVEMAYFSKAKKLLESILVNLKERDFGNYPRLQNEVLLGLLKCEVHFKNPLASERIAKIQINPNFINAPYFFKNLSWESNNLYWLNKVKWIAFLGLVFIYLSFISSSFNLSLGFDLHKIGGFLIGGSWIYFIINKDNLSYTPLEIIIRPNTTRKWLNARFGWKLGKQDDLVHQKEKVRE